MLKTLAPLRQSAELQMIVKYLRMEYEDILDAIVTCPQERVMELRGGAMAYRDLIQKLTRMLEQINTIHERESATHAR